MASINGILNPTIENSLNEMDDNAIGNMPVPQPSVWDYVKTSASNAYMSSTGIALGAWLAGKGSPNYNEQQLRDLYPDTPDNYWKGGANAFQAEYLYDRYKRQQERDTEKALITNSTDPNAVGSTTLDAIGFGGSLAGDIADPLNMVAYGIGTAATKVAGAGVYRVAPAFMEALSSSKYIKGGAALGGGLINTIGATLAAEVGIKYPLQQSILNEYEKKQRSLGETVKQSVGSAIVMGTLGHYGGQLFKSIFGREGGAAPEFVDGMKNQSFYKAKDQANAYLGSESARTSNFTEAVNKVFTPDGNAVRASNTELMATKAFNMQKTPEFKLTAPFYGVYEKGSGKLDYAGERYGDTHVFMSSPEAAQGMLDTYAHTNPYLIYGHKGGLNLLDLENTPANDHPEVLDIIENEMGKGIFHKVSDNASLAEVFREVMNSEEHEGISGNDVVDMFNRVNKTLAAQGFEGTLHKEQMGNTNHDVMSVFDPSMKDTDLQKIYEGKTSTPDVTVVENPPISRAESDITTFDGQTIKADEEVPHDIFYDNDPEFKKEYDRLNDPEYLKQVQETINSDPLVIDIETAAKEVSSDIKETINQVSQAIGTEKTELDPTVKYYGELETQAKEVQKEIKNATPEKENEFVKAIENCLRKH